MVYLDNSATTRVDDKVIELMNLYFKEHYGNPSSLHKMGVVAEKAVEEARVRIAELIHTREDSIYFVSGGTEGNNLAISSAVNKNKGIGKKIITTRIEHPSVLEVFKHYKSRGYDVCFLDVDDRGFVDIDQLRDEVNPQTALVSVMKVNNEIGVVQDTKTIGEIVKSRSPKCIFHSDCVQALGKVPLDPEREGVDILTFSGHKFHGPKGIGGVYIAKSLSLNPMLLGGGQERGMRSGTENVPAIAGMGLAAKMISDDFEKCTKHFQKLKRSAMEKLYDEIEGVHFNSGSDENFAPHILNISVEDVKAEIILHMLEKSEVYMSTGSACASRKKSRSHVLKAMGLEDNLVDGALRISFSKYNTVEEVEYTVEKLKEAVSFLRKYTRR